MRIEIVGVHPVDAPEPCHLVELLVEDAGADFDLGAITQEKPGQPRENWQVPWDEQLLEPHGEAPTEPAGGHSRGSTPVTRVAFFFHYLDFGRALLSPAGPLVLPEPTPVPLRLASLKYESPW